jgi:hypothetical protein
MAYWTRRPNRAVYVFDTVNGKQVALARKHTRHLDREPDHNVERWVQNWTLTHNIKRPAEGTLTHQDTLKLLDQFGDYQRSRGKAPKTVDDYRRFLADYVLPFFVQVENLSEPTQWPTKSVRLYHHLHTTRQAGPRTVDVCNVALRQFWKWLVEEGVATGTLHLRNSVKLANNTPLQFTLTPDQLLAHNFKSPKIRLLALIGYFFSLRPQELVALRPCDFRAGSQAILLECCRVMNKAGLYNKFAVSVTRQRRGTEFVTPKRGSSGFVACFNERAAKEIVASLRGLAPDELIFPARIDQWYKVWRGEGYPGLTLKDLSRRASVYFLGHYGGLEFVGLKNHARHSDPATTALYVRRPGEDQGEFTELDLDA